MWTDYLIPVILGLVIGVLLMMYRNNDYTTIKVINKKDFINNMRKGQLIDLRSPDEFANDKIKGARNYRSRQIAVEKSKLRRDQSVFLYCSNGKKSYRTAKKMTKKGFITIYVLAHGFNSIKDESNTL